MPTPVIALFASQRKPDSQNSGVDERVEKVCYRNLRPRRSAFHDFKSVDVRRVGFSHLFRWCGFILDFEVFMREAVKEAQQFGERATILIERNPPSALMICSQVSPAETSQDSIPCCWQTQ